MNIININKEANMREEVAFISNSPKYKIDIYTNTTSKCSYVFRRRSNQQLVCELDENLNIIGGLKSLVLLNDLDIAFERLNDYVNRTSWVDDFFDF